ncbi:MAG: hypothetical protein R3275_02045 [Saprospiraceae bacterium]|nr:hypothetical protein [Saprospiraceae bacterium]
MRILFLFTFLMFCLGCAEDCPECTTPAEPFRFIVVDEEGNNLLEPSNPDSVTVRSLVSPGKAAYQFGEMAFVGPQVENVRFIEVQGDLFYLNAHEEGGTEVVVNYQGGELSDRFFVEMIWESVPEDEDCSCLIERYAEVSQNGQDMDFHSPRLGIYALRKNN